MAVITISRQFGAGGKTLGRMIAGKLGYNLVDEDVIQKVAEKANVSKDWVESVEKEAGGKLVNFMNGLISKSYIERVVGEGRGYLDEDIYVDILNEVIRKTAEEGNVVIIGRGGQYILQDYPDAFHILLVAEEKDRIAFMEKHYKMSRTEAVRIVGDYDKRRANLYRKFGKTGYDQPNLYHVVLNMSKMELEDAAEFVYRMVADVVCELVTK